MTYTPKSQHVPHRSDERYDEIKIGIAERWKESELSGDEWRFNGFIEFKKKGRVIHVQTFRNVEEAARCLPALMLGVGMRYPNDDEDSVWNALNEANEDKCDNPGCAERATHIGHLIERWDREGNRRPVREGGEHRIFCSKHRHRGDCALDDADSNYRMELIDDTPVQ